MLVSLYSIFSYMRRQKCWSGFKSQRHSVLLFLHVSPLHMMFSCHPGCMLTGSKQEQQCSRLVWCVPDRNLLKSEALKEKYHSSEFNDIMNVCIKMNMNNMMYYFNQKMTIVSFWTLSRNKGRPSFSGRVTEGSPDFWGRADQACHIQTHICPEWPQIEPRAEREKQCPSIVFTAYPYRSLGADSYLQQSLAEWQGT